MTASHSILFEIAAECDARGIRLIPGCDGYLKIDAPRGSLTPEFLDRLKAHKTEILSLLLRAADFDVDNAPNAEPAPVIEPNTSKNAVCRCGSTAWRDVLIHDGQSLRRDCGRCGRFLGWPIWYGSHDTLSYEPATSKSEAGAKAVAHG
jgi:hypothetical protein